MVTKLVLGKIPAFTKCPFTSRCAFVEKGICKHKGENHNVDFSCAVSRAYDLVDRNVAEHKPIEFGVRG